MLYSYLQNNYAANEPIFLSEVSLPGVSSNTLRQMFKKLCDAGKLQRFEDGVYYLPAPSRLKGGGGITPEIVAARRYVESKGKVDGYYSGFTLANRLGLTTQVPYMQEITTNNTSGNYRVITLRGRRFALRKAQANVTNQNYQVLQFLDLLKDIEKYADAETEDVAGKVASYVRTAGIKKADVDQYIFLYPVKIFKNFYELGLYDVLA